MPNPDILSEAPLPKLTKPQLARLAEIGRGQALHPRTCKSSSAYLIAIGAVVVGFTLIDGPKCYLRPLGIRILAGLPGDEFARFRTMLEEEINA